MNHITLYIIALYLHRKWSVKFVAPETLLLYTKFMIRTTQNHSLYDKAKHKHN